MPSAHSAVLISSTVEDGGPHHGRFSRTTRDPTSNGSAQHAGLPTGSRCVNVNDAPSDPEQGGLSAESLAYERALELSSQPGHEDEAEALFSVHTRSPRDTRASSREPRSRSATCSSGARVARPTPKGRGASREASDDPIYAGRGKLQPRPPSRRAGADRRRGGGAHPAATAAEDEVAAAARQVLAQLSQVARVERPVPVFDDRRWDSLHGGRDDGRDDRRAVSTCR